MRIMYVYVFLGLGREIGYMHYNQLQGKGPFLTILRLTISRYAIIYVKISLLCNKMFARYFKRSDM